MSIDWFDLLTHIFIHLPNASFRFSTSNMGLMVQHSDLTNEVEWIPVQEYF